MSKQLYAVTRVTTSVHEAWVEATSKDQALSLAKAADPKASVWIETDEPTYRYGVALKSLEA